MQQSMPLFGAVADIVKAYNALPRCPAFEFLRLMGVPTWFISVWSDHLQQFTRFFVVNGDTSSADFDDVPNVPRLQDLHQGDVLESNRSLEALHMLQPCLV